MRENLEAASALFCLAVLAHTGCHDPGVRKRTKVILARATTLLDEAEADAQSSPGDHVERALDDVEGELRALGAVGGSGVTPPDAEPDPGHSRDPGGPQG